VIPERRKKGEAVKLYCARCTWSTDVAMADTATSTAVPCVHCAAMLYWHRCPTCSLCYAGAEAPSCPVCDDASLEDVGFD